MQICKGGAIQAAHGKLTWISKEPPLVLRDHEPPLGLREKLQRCDMDLDLNPDTANS